MCLICFRQFTLNFDSSLRVYESGASLAHFWAPDVKIRGSYGRRHGPLSTLSEAKIPISPQHRAPPLILHLTTACLPIYPPPPNSAHAPEAYLASDIDRPGYWAISKTRSSGGAPCRVRGCSFRPPIVSRSRPQRARFLAAHDQSDGSTRPPYDSGIFLERNLPGAVCLFAPINHYLYSCTKLLASTKPCTD